MKIKLDIDCTPEEARSFLGLPDVRPMQEALLRQAQDKMGAAMAAMEPEALMRAWLPAGMQGLEQMQRFWSQFAAAGGKKDKG